MSGDLTEAEAKAILKLEKFVVEDRMTWSESPDHSSQQVCNFGLVDANGATLRGLTVQLTHRIPPAYDDCKYTFSVFQFAPGGWKRAYQLEVIPLDIIGHVDTRGRIYGPHEHVGSRTSKIRVGNLGCKQYEPWFRVFCERANINFQGMCITPFEGRMF